MIRPSTARNEPCRTLIIHGFKPDDESQALSSELGVRLRALGEIKKISPFGGDDTTLVTYYDLRAAEEAALNRWRTGMIDNSPFVEYFPNDADHYRFGNQGTLLVTLCDSNSQKVIDDLELFQIFKHFGDVKQISPVGECENQLLIEMYDMRDTEKAYFRLQGLALQDGTMHIEFAWDVAERPLAPGAIWEHMVGIPQRIASDDEPVPRPRAYYIRPPSDDDEPIPRPRGAYYIHPPSDDDEPIPRPRGAYYIHPPSSNDESVPRPRFFKRRCQPDDDDLRPRRGRSPRPNKQRSSIVELDWSPNHNRSAPHPHASLPPASTRHEPSAAQTPLTNRNNLATGVIPGVQTPSLAGGTRPVTSIDSRKTSCEEMFQHLVNHGCVDLSSRMDPAQYSSGLILGGAFGDIWKGKLHGGTEVAIKRAMREIYNWSKAKHENIQELMGVIMFQGRLGMVSLWMEHGNLRDYLRKNPNANRLSLGTQVAAGLSYLHNQSMVHGDLKAVNILVSKDVVAKISDFDHSILSDCTLVFSETTNIAGGTLRWMAPELLLSSEEDNSPPTRRNKQSDVYALGMTMLEIITGDIPYSEYRDDHGVYRALDKQQSPKRPTELLDLNEWGVGTWELLLECWAPNPLVRPSSSQVHERLKSIKNGAGAQKS